MSGSLIRVRCGRLSLTRMLSGLMSACMTLHLCRSERPRNSWWAYARTALMLRPTSLPKRLMTSRKFMLMGRERQLSVLGRAQSRSSETNLSDSKTMHR